MKEHQLIEWKPSWRDEYLKWVCGFANAEGGVLVIGRDDAGKAIGVKDAARLLEEVPNKVRDILGIMVDVNLRREAGKELVEIRVEPYLSPISYKGEYHYRSGSTKQELKGAALDKSLLRKQGRTWDSVPVPHVTIRDLSSTAISGFRKLARQSRRLDADVRGESVAALIERLNLLEGTYLKRAAVLLFHPNPERYITGAFVKIGYFQADSELLYHDEVHGDLFTQAQKTMEVLLSKYLKAAISYRGIQRVERFPVPEEALREALLNAIIHRDYSVGAPIQFRVRDDQLSIWNPGELPEGWSLAKFLKQHSSRPFNPCVANAFFRAGEIEAWGRGIQRIFTACQEAEVPEPRILYELGDVLPSSVPAEGRPPTFAEVAAMSVRPPLLWLRRVRKVVGRTRRLLPRFRDALWHIASKTGSQRPARTHPAIPGDAETARQPRRKKQQPLRLLLNCSSPQIAVIIGHFSYPPSCSVCFNPCHRWRGNR